MPRKAKEKTELIIEETKVTENKTKKKTAVSKKSTTSSKVDSKKASKKTPSKNKENEAKVKVETTKKETKKKQTTSSTKNKTSTTTKKTTVKKETTKKRAPKKKIEILEYYDLPYRYNQTVVKVLAQTPNTLFVYWDISDEDKENYIKQYGEYFFNNTKPVLIIHNKTNNYDFEIDINDFANSWYLQNIDSNCEYLIELGRRPINQYVTISNNYLPIAYSNNMDAPNDHILFDNLSNFVYFRNVKTNITTEKNIANLSLLRKIGKLYSIKEFYKKLYPEETINLGKLDLRNPSSSNPTSSFK